MVSHPMCPSLSIHPSQAWLRYMAPYVSRIDGLRDKVVSPAGARLWGVLLLYLLQASPSVDIGWTMPKSMVWSSRIDVTVKDDDGKMNTHSEHTQTLSIPFRQG